MAHLGRNFIADFRSRRPRPPGGILVLAVLILFAGLPLAVDSAPRDYRGREAASIVDKVDGVRLERLIRALSGTDSITVDGTRAKIKTRYALSPQKELAQRFLIDEVRSAGYEPSIQRFLLNVQKPDLTGLALSMRGDSAWVADVDGRIYMTTEADGWAPFARRGDLRESVFALQRDPRGRLWAACRLSTSAYGALYLSLDGGASWSLRYLGTSTNSLGTIAFGDTQFAMAAGSNGAVIRTFDGGESWSALAPATFGSESINDAATTGPRHFWLITAYGSLYETANFGGSWSKRSLMFGRLAAIDFSGESTGVIVGSNRAFYTRDAGATWASVTVETEFTAVSMLDSLRVLAAGTGGEIWISEDGGAAWSRFGTECPVAADVWNSASVGDGWLWLTGRDLTRRLYWDSSLRSCDAYQFADSIWGQNISFLHEGVGTPEHRVFLTAHYDAISASPDVCAPGADDDGTGTVAVIECARALRDERTERSIEFVLFDGEEIGLRGSHHFADNLDTAIVYDGDIQLDMIGYEPNEVMTAIIARRPGEAADSTLAALIESAEDSFDLALETDVIEDDHLASDQMAFWAVGIPAVLLIEGNRGELTPHYHSCTDVAANLNLEFFEVCTKTALGAVALLAGLIPPEVVPERLALYQNFPNPFNAGTTVSFALAETADVELAVYDVSGRRVALIERGRLGRGVFHREWDGTDGEGRRLASGIYLMRLRAGAAGAVRKIVILR